MANIPGILGPEMTQNMPYDMPQKYATRNTVVEGLPKRLGRALEQICNLYPGLLPKAIHLPSH
jgi:hypothetical protein